MKVVHEAKEKWADIFIGEVTARSVATGFALGTFVALLPSFGFSLFLGLGLSFLFPNINRPAVFLALAIWNPLMQIPIYALSFTIGSDLFGTAPVVKYNFEILNQVHTFTRRFLVGHMIVTMFITIFSYLSSYLIAKNLLNKSTKS